MLNQIQTDSSVKVEDRDVIGGGGIFATDIYGARIDLAYTIESQKGAVGLVLHLTTQDGRKYNETIYITNRQKQMFYTKDGEKYPLPGYLLANSLALLTVGKEITQLDTEEKVVSVYNHDAKKEIPTKVQAVTALMGEEIYAAIEQTIEDKNVKNDSGDYVPSGETRESNSLVKFFRTSDRKTVSEITEKVDEAEFYTLWLEKNKGKVRNRAKGAATGGAQAGAPKAAGQAGASNAQPTQSLFGKS